MAGKKKRWDVGSVFLVPLKDKTECVGQVIGREKSVLNSVAIALFDLKGNWSSSQKIPPLRAEDIFSTVLATKDLLDSGRWVALDKEAIRITDNMKPYESLRDGGFIGARVHGSGVVEEFANAFYGLTAWDDWYIPDFLDGMLISPDKKPIERLSFSGRHG
ncbi:immunity 26/phosphotriesterase HocA family protein [Luteimonas sp. Y-2-2-4F]|nr:immunity 26/phosphotriesterase HocA family protein [Luteimonas sp. Y-2-2-4F]MCD9033824.1 immunity 26/phosphotriesterase HocA family protein [Luteimonas sp. Y-2-2-4F]